LVPDQTRLGDLRSGVDRAFDARERAGAGAERGDDDPWYWQFEPEPEYELAVGFGRQFVNAGSGVWLADSPRMLFELTEAFEAAGLRDLIGDYLGERPAISVNKGTLRRAAPDVASGWHQDGAFLGDGIRSINVWLALNDCGRDAPGMEIVARRLDRIVETGTHGAQFEWSVGQAVVDEVASEAIAMPEFKAGDALLFDHFNLHRTGLDPSMTETRYATETWFFAPSAYPDPNDQVPLAF
ncbi:MAG TPA: phytanoyl-CoA dioxygenase family protein, partial [Solirubrobacterales bacterium]|nr:phytanoyl-CoA dioxygenase family protein [Solirubrobacterales bacterium]